jgi:hypothetical protein
MPNKSFAILVVATLLAGCASTDFDQIGSDPDYSIDVSPYQLLAAPEKYDGRLISVMGVASFDFSFEGISFIYPTKDDYRYQTDSYIRLYTFSKELSAQRATLSQLNGRFILVAGIFHAQAIPDPTPPGQIGCLWPGCNGGGYISEIRYVQRVE